MQAPSCGRGERTLLRPDPRHAQRRGSGAVGNRVARDEAGEPRRLVLAEDEAGEVRLPVALGRRADERVVRVCGCVRATAASVFAPARELETSTSGNPGSDASDPRTTFTPGTVTCSGPTTPTASLGARGRRDRRGRPRRCRRVGGRAAAAGRDEAEAEHYEDGRRNQSHVEQRRRGGPSWPAPSA